MCSFWRLLSLAQCKLITTSCHNSTLKKLNLTLKLHHLIPEGSNWEPKFEFNQRNMVLCQFCFWNEILFFVKKNWATSLIKTKSIWIPLLWNYKTNFPVSMYLTPNPWGGQYRGFMRQGFQGRKMVQTDYHWSK